MADFTYTPDQSTQIDVGKYAAGVTSEIARRWGRHVIPGQQGSLKENLGDGDLKSTFTLAFVGKTQADYGPVMTAITKTGRGVLVLPGHQARQTIVDRIRERRQFTTMGPAVIVDVYLEDAIIGQADSFTAGPSARAQQVVAQASAADIAVGILSARVFLRPNIAIRNLMLTATASATASTSAARTYAAAAQEAFTLGFYDPITQAQLRALPPLVQLATKNLQAVGPASNTQDSVLALEVMLFSASQLDAAIRAAQPIPIDTEISRSPGQSIYAFVQQHYGKSGKTPAEMRNLVSLILRINPQIRRPALMPVGLVVTRPAS